MTEERLLNPVQVRYSDDRSFIYVSINPREVLQHKLEPEDILEALIDTGFSSFEYQLEQVVLEELVRLPWNRLNRVIIRRIAYRVEFDLKIIHSPDRMTASVSVSPAFQQEKISRERLIERLSHSGIKKGIIDEAVDLVVSLGEIQQIEIATGTYPEHGRDSWLEIMCMPLQLDTLELVEPGTPLARRHPPTPGVDGYKVSGQTLPAHPGQVLNLVPGDGCDFAPDDSHLLVATQAGLPVFNGLQVRVDPLIEVDADKLEPFYLYSVLIKGDLPEQTQVRSAGHLIIDGAVKGGELIAEAELICRRPVEGPVWLQSAGDMHLLKAEHGILYCGRNLRVSEDLVHCQSFVGGQMLSPTGRLRGGAMHCLDGAVLWEHGTEYSEQTDLQLGKDLHFQERLFSLQASGQDLRRQHEELLRRLIRLRSLAGATPETEALSLQQRALIYRDISLKGEMEVLTRVLDADAWPEVVVRGTVHPNARFGANDSTLLVEVAQNAVRLRCYPDQPLKLEPIAE